MPGSIAENYQHILSKIADACSRTGRVPDEVSVVAVSKTVGMAEVARAIQAGIHDFGENRTVLFDEKYRAFSDERWHFIGRIQTNKIKDFVGRAALIHSVASERALLGIAHHAQKVGTQQKVLLEANVSGEASKDGVAPEELPALLEVASRLEGVVVDGLMTMAPQGDPGAARRAFNDLRELRDRLSPQFEGCSRVQLTELSMGMSEDYALAVEEGATIVRIGRSIWL